MIRVRFEYDGRAFTVEGHYTVIESRRCSFSPILAVVMTRLESASGLVYEPLPRTPLEYAAIEALTAEAKRQRGE